MTIVLTGGGSGGHITPLLAVARELKKLEPSIRIVYIGQKGDKLADVPANNPDIDEVYSVRAGKFRRYSGQGIKQVLDIKTVAKNVRDSGRTVKGLTESRRLLKRIKPDVIFIKGGFVGVPVGLAAAQLHIPFVTHDSDSIPGLANRIISRWATAHAVALPKSLYDYPSDKTFTVGVPISSDYQPVTSTMYNEYKKELGLDKYRQIIFVTGGGNGARQLNKIVASCALNLLTEHSDLAIVHLAGRDYVEETQDDYSHLPPDLSSRVIVKDFVNNLYAYSGAADVIIARGSATNLAEFALQCKACIIIPAPQLVWTIKNTEALAKNDAVVALDENNLLKNGSAALANACSELLDSADKRKDKGKKLSNALAHNNSARELAELLIKQTDSNNKNVS